MTEQYPHDDEISLVDLAKILVRRRWWVYGTVIVTVGAALIAALLMRGGPVYEVITIYEVADYSNTAGEQQPLQATRGLIQRLESVYRPAL